MQEVRFSQHQLEAILQTTNREHNDDLNVLLFVDGLKSTRGWQLARLL